MSQLSMNDIGLSLAKKMVDFSLFNRFLGMKIRKLKGLGVVLRVGEELQ